MVSRVASPALAVWGVRTRPVCVEQCGVDLGFAFEDIEGGADESRHAAALRSGPPRRRFLIGKSRLTAALLERLAGEPHTRLRYFCSPQHTDSAFYPIIGQMERAAGLAHDDKPQAKLDKLDAVLAQTSTSTEDAALFAEMLSLPNDGRYPALELAPEQRRQRTLEALTSQLADWPASNRC